MIENIENRTLVASAVIKKCSKHLLVYDPKFRFWRYPGGRVEEREDCEQTLRREMPEELGIKIEVVKSLGWGVDDVPIYGVPGKERTSRMIIYCECRILEGTPAIKDVHEISKIRRAYFKEILQIPDLEPAMRDFFIRFGYLKQQI